MTFIKFIKVPRSEYDRLRKAEAWHKRRESRLVQAFRATRNKLTAHNRALAEENVRLRKEAERE